MITANISGSTLDLPTSFTFERIINSQLTSFDAIKGDLVPSITFPSTENNRNVLDHPNRFSLVRDGEKVYSDFELRSDGYIIIRGELVLTSAYSGYVRGMVGVLGATQKDQLITDIELPEDVTFENKENYVPGTDHYCCPCLLNSDFFAGISRSYTYTYASSGVTYEETCLQHKHRNMAYAVNFQDSGVGVKINNEPLIFNGFASEDAYMLTVVSPQLFLFYVIEKLLKVNGFFVTSNQIDSSDDLRKICIYNNVDINTGEAGTTEVLVDYQETIENRAVAKYQVDSITRSISTFNYSDLLPEISLKNFILGIQNMLNIAIVFNNDNTVTIIDREQQLLADPQFDLSKYIASWELGEKLNVSLKFTATHDSNDVYFGELYLDLSDRLEDFADDVADMAVLEALDGAFLGELRRVLSTQRIYEWSQIVTEEDDSLGLEMEAFAWVYVSSDFQPGWINYDLENEVEEINTNFSTLTSKVLPPATIQQGRSVLRKKSEAPFSPRLLFYTGDGDGTNNTDNYALRFTGDYNLIDTRYKYFGKFWAKRQVVETTCHIPDNILFSIDVNQKQRSFEGDFIIERMVTQFTHAGTGATKIEGYKVELLTE